MERVFSRRVLSSLALLLAPALAAADSGKPVYEANIASLSHYQAPEWYQDAKFGIWAHWGPYSVPAFGGRHAAEWYPRHMYDTSDSAGHHSHHKATYGSPSEFGYKDFIPLFTAERFDADHWIDLAEAAGAQFYSVVALHHDGFSMYDSDHTQWNSVEMGPKRDIVDELFTAARARGMKVGVTNHFAHNLDYYEHLFEYGGDWAPEYQDLYSHGGEPDEWYMNRWWNRTAELVDKYQPDLYYFDWGWNRPSMLEAFEGQRERFLAYYYNAAIAQGKGEFGDPNVVMNFKGRTLPRSVAIQDVERGGRNQVSDHVWQADTSISKHSWSYSEVDDYWSTTEMLHTLIDVVSKNGVMMLNFGPRADGTVPDEYGTVLREMGQWLAMNGEAIYETRPYQIHGEGPTVRTAKNRLQLKRHGYNYGAEDIRFTRNKANDTLYVTALAMAEAGQVRVTSLNAAAFDMAGIASVRTLDGQAISWRQEQDALILTWPQGMAESVAYVAKLQFKETLPKLKR
ncbi:alpha-L-fucosidase [Ferrimonas pelagia]|uniref:alpha-L-fucosidase n=1 Tax=Ferrimonas pelagia TaxID=1177826 RepID=A0ABP9EKM5_9GAMM